MNKKLSYLILTLLCIFSSTKSYSQREIHPLEQMFTYDFKYYGNLTLDNFWSLENFKAPRGIKSIEEYEEHSSENFRRRVSFFHSTNRIHFYNEETGFLEKTITYDERNGFKEKRYIQIYKYRIDGLNLIINVEYSFFGKELYDSQYYRYVYDLKTENLVEFGYCNKDENEQITRYIYDENQKDLISILKDEVEKYKIFIKYHTLQPFDKMFFDKISEIYKVKDDCV